MVRYLQLAVIVAVWAVAWPVGAAEPVAHVKLKHDERLITADILASDDGRYVFVNGQNWVGQKWQLNVLRTSDWNAYGPLRNAASNGTEYPLRRSCSTLFYDAKACELLVPQAGSVGVVPTDPASLSSLKDATAFPREDPLNVGSNPLTPWRVAVRPGSRFRFFSFTEAVGVQVSEVTKPGPGGPARPPFQLRGAVLDSSCRASVSAGGKYALLASAERELAGPANASEVRTEACWDKTCLVCVNLDDMKAVAGIDVPGPAITASLVHEDTLTAVCGRDDGAVLFFDLKKQVRVGDALNLTGNTIARLSLSPDGKHLLVVSLGSRANIYVIDMSTRKLVPVGDLGRQAHVCAVGFSPKGDRLYTLNMHGEFFAWDFAALVTPKAGK